MACDRAYCAPGAGGRGWPREGRRGRHHRTEPQPRLYTLCPSPSQRHALASDYLQLKWSKHITPCAPGPLSAAQQQQAVRGQGTVCAALTCAVRASTRVMATQLTLDYRGGELQAAHTVPQRTGHGAPKAAPPSLKHTATDNSKKTWILEQGIVETSLPTQLLVSSPSSNGRHSSASRCTALPLAGPQAVRCATSAGRGRCGLRPRSGPCGDALCPGP